MQNNKKNDKTLVIIVFHVYSIKSPLNKIKFDIKFCFLNVF